MTVSDTVNDSEDLTLSTSGIPIRNLWYILLYAWNEVATRDHCRTEVEQSPTLDALLASMLVRLMQQRLRIGLGRSYMDQGRILHGIRGRIDFSESLKRLTFQNGQAYCLFQEFRANAPKNQIVRSALTRLVQIGQFGPDKAQAEELRQRLRRLIRDLEGIDLVEVNLDLIRRQHLGRNDGDYRLMLAICELILQRQMPTEAMGHDVLPGLDRDAMTLHQVYERFVANFYRMHLGEWSVVPQAPLDWHATKSSPYLPAMRPDLVLRHRRSGRVVVLDTKFTPYALSRGRFGRDQFDSSHLYQLYAYLRSQERSSDQDRAASGILLYPTVRQHISEEVELQGHSIQLETVDLSLPWMEIEERLIAIIDK